MVYRDRAEAFELVQPGRNWDIGADGRLLRLASEAYRIRLAHLFDPHLAVHTSLVEPLPHQITAVYEAMLPRQPLRFLLADDPGAGKTISSTLTLLGHYLQEDSSSGTVGAELALAPALQLAVLGGEDEGLALGAYARHLGSEPRSAIPGLDLLAAAKLGGEDLDSFLLHGSAALTLVRRGYALRPAFTYRDDATYRAYIGELGGSAQLGGGFTLTAQARLARLEQDDATWLPEASLGLRSEQGALLTLSYTHNLPLADALPRFASRDPREEVRFGVRVGYQVMLGRP